jgi:ketosteroid isomerase-like protein
VNIESEKKKILSILDEFTATAIRKDVEGRMELLADDFVIIFGKFQVIEGKGAFREVVRKTIENYVDARYVPLRVEVSSSGDLAWLLAYEIAKYKKQEGIVEIKTPFMWSFKKEDGKWKIVASCEG